MNNLSKHPAIYIIGVGKPDRGDDGIGILVSRQLQSLDYKNVLIKEIKDDILPIMDQWTIKDDVIIIDAVSSGAPPGTLHRIDAIRKKIPPIFRNCSTHTIGLNQLIELSNILKKQPRTLVIYGIEGQNFEIGSTISPQALLKIPIIQKIILMEIKKIQHLR